MKTTQPMLRRVTIERRDDGTWKVVRERDVNGETFTADNLYDAFATVLAAYHPDGTAREPRSRGAKPVAPT